MTEKVFDIVTIRKGFVGKEREPFALVFSFDQGTFGRQTKFNLSKQTWELIGKEMGWSK